MHASRSSIAWGERLAKAALPVKRVCARATRQQTSDRRSVRPANVAGVNHAGDMAEPRGLIVALSPRSTRSGEYKSGGCPLALFSEEHSQEALRQAQNLLS